MNHGIQRSPSASCTPSTVAREFGFWQEWCRALECNGKSIDKILEVEGQSWLLDETWRVTWKMRSDYDPYCSESENDFEGFDVERQWDSDVDSDSGSESEKYGGRVRSD